MTYKYNPGSREAIDRGCKCPVFDNEFGAGCGCTDLKGNPTFWVTDTCPLHGDNGSDRIREKKTGKKRKAKRTKKVPKRKTARI